MEYEKQKKIRAKLIKYTNQQLKNQKHNKIKFLINSISLEELEKKNMRCKEFFIEEKTQIYQNIDNKRSIVQNIYIKNNSFSSNIVIFPLSSRIISNNMIKNTQTINNSNLNMTYIDINSNNTIERIHNKRSGFIKQTNLESPVDQCCLFKKELGERKLRKSKNEINMNAYNSFNEDELNKEKCEKNIEKDEINKNESEKYKQCSKQLSTETLATEISRIIKACHNEKNINSFELSRSDSKIEETEDIKKARKYAKKLKYYCRTLKNKYPYKSGSRQNNRIKKIENKIYDINIKDKANINLEKEDKKNIHKNKKVEKKTNVLNDKEKKNYKKKNSEKIKEKDIILIDIENYNNNVGYSPINKKIKSDRNLKQKIKRDSFVYSEDNYNNVTEQSTNNHIQYKANDNESKTKSKINSTIVKILKKKTKKYLENDKSKLKNKKQKEKTISLAKKIKKEILQNFMKKIKNRILETSNNNENNNSKRHSKVLKKISLQKEESPYPLNDIKNKRNSIDTRMISKGSSGLECIFIDTKNLSISEGLSTLKKKKKKHSDKIGKVSDNIINENDNLSPINKRNKIKKNKAYFTYKENNQEKKDEIKKLLKIKKTKTLFLKKKPKNKNKRKISPILSEEKDINNTIDNDSNKKYINNSKKTTFKLDESAIEINNDNFYTNEDKDDFNILDEYLYKKKHKRIKNKNK